MLTDAQIEDLWRHFEVPDWDRWRAGYHKLLSELHTLTDDELAAPEAQERLWSARALCTLGPGEHIDVSGAWSDPEVVRAVLALRRRDWPLALEPRAAAIEEAYADLLALVHPRHAAARPSGRLHRLMAVMLPRDLHCAINWSANRDVVELLLPPRRRVSPVASQVLVRARLRDVLGEEELGDLGAYVRRSVFCWWLHGQAEPLRQGHGVLRPVAREPFGDAAPLVLWPEHRRARGWHLPSRPLACFRALARLAQGGAGRDDLVEALGVDPRWGRLSPRTRRGLVMQARVLGLLEPQHGELTLTSEGLELLESDPPDVLVERLLQRVDGFDAGLWLLGDAGPEGLTRDELRGHLVTHCAGDDDGAHAEAIMGCLEALCVAQDGPRWCLSDYGQSWVSRLSRPQRVAGRARPVEARRAQDGHGEPSTTARSPKRVLVEHDAGVGQAADQDSAFLSGLGLAELRRLLSQRRPELVLDDDQLEALHVAWHCQPTRRFVILSGLSGTGKTALALAYARAACHLSGVDPEAHTALVAVSPDWRDPSGLLGYFNGLHAEPAFLAEPALRLILRAARTPSAPCFLILDEMNLAHVERYMSPLLSAMETGEPLRLHTLDSPVSGVPPRVPWPRNLFIAGTVNMDETTHSLSDKVLDRAFTLEFWSVDLPRFFEQRAAQLQVPRNDALETLLCELCAALEPCRRHFGYRSAGEVLAFVEAAGRLTGGERGWQRAADVAIQARILPRLRGEDTPALRKALSDAEAICVQAGLSLSARRLEALHQRLSTLGVTRFWA